MLPDHLARPRYSKAEQIVYTVLMAAGWFAFGIYVGAQICTAVCTQ